MDPTLFTIAVYVAAALIIATLFLIVRDLSRRKPEKPKDVSSLLPPTEAAAAAARDDSWLGQLACQAGAGFTSETSILLAILIGLAVGGGVFLWRNDWLAGVAASLVGVLVVGGLLLVLRFRRHRAIREQLPDVMEYMARAVRAGESLDQAIALAGNSGLKPVASDFQYCASQMRMGLSLESAIRGMVDREPLAETRILAMTLILQRRRGGSLPTTLERLARVFRDRSSFFRQFQASTALGRGSAALIALIALGLDAFVVLSNSEYAESLLLTDPGRIMLAVSIVLQIVGITWAIWLFRSHI
jgi:tight adherence protein B